MIVVDASVWLSAVVDSDANHLVSRKWQSAWPLLGLRVHMPSIVLAEIGGTVSRRTGSEIEAFLAVNSVLAHPFVQIHEMTAELIAAASQLAIELRLKGADSIYVALAHSANGTLVTWDREQRSRAASIVTALDPAAHLAVISNEAG